MTHVGYKASESSLPARSLPERVRSQSGAQAGIEESRKGDFVTVGTIQGAHGLRGEIKVRPLTDVPNRFEQIEQVHVEAPDGRRCTTTILRARSQGPWYILACDGITTRDMAEEWICAELKVPEASVPRLPEGEYYHYELLGMDVVTEGGMHLGTITDIFSTGSNDVFVVKQKNTEHLIPAIRDVVIHVDIDQQRMVVRPVEGLLSHNAL